MASFEEAFTPALVHLHQSQIQRAQLLVIDANLPSSVIEASIFSSHHSAGASQARFALLSAGLQSTIQSLLCRYLKAAGRLILQTSKDEKLDGESLDASSNISP